MDVYSDYCKYGGSQSDFYKVAEKTGNDVKWYYYDGDGTREAIEYKGNTYYYFYNAQGDVMGLYDNNLNVVVEYAYDSWGNVVSITGSLADTLGKDNPFRYRGYYFDSDTGLYYLNSRYYDANTGRFVNGDKKLAGNATIQGYNLFTYCFNNPVNMSDEDGNWPKWVESAANWIETKVVNPVKKTLVAAAKSLEFEAGIGLGLKGSIAVATAEVNIGVKGDPFNVVINKDGIKPRTKLEGKASITAYKTEIGKQFEQTHDYSCPCKFIGKCPYNNYTESKEPFLTDPSLEIIGFEAYFFVGANLQLKFNLDTFAEEMGLIELYEE